MVFCSCLYLTIRGNQLLNFLESGHIKVTQMRRNYDFVIKGCKVFATANDTSKLSKPLASRFRKLFLPRYTEEQFLIVSQKVLPFLSTGLAGYIGNAVFKNGGDIRDVISIGKLVRKNDGPEQIEQIMSTIVKYGYRLTMEMFTNNMTSQNKGLIIWSRVWFFTCISIVAAFGTLYIVISYCT